MSLYAKAKRAEDIALSVVFIIAASPLFIFAVAGLVLSGVRPVIFKQRRAGKDGKPFMLYKFRSMTNERDEHGKLLPDERRLTKFGTFLRRSSIDELPQFFNVLNGDMSLVGPRPLFVEYMPIYSEKHKHRLDVPQGLTGYGQITTRGPVPFSKRFDTDIYYVEHASFIFDNIIILKTFFALFKVADSLPYQGEELDDVGLAGAFKKKEDAQNHTAKNP